MPILAFTFYLCLSSFTINTADITARTGSSLLENGGKPQHVNITEPLSSIRNLLRLPLVK